MEESNESYKRGLYDTRNEHDNCGIGFVVQITGEQTNDIIKRGLQVLENMSHRGATGADDTSGDGAGILIQTPHDFFIKQKISLPEKGKYGTGIIFLPKNESTEEYLNILKNFIHEARLNLTHIRDVPVENNSIGTIARNSEPIMKQVFIVGDLEQEVLERKLYLIRKQTENAVFLSNLTCKNEFYIVSLSSKVMIYKGMLSPTQLRRYYIDLQNKEMKSAIALVHSRFSTNTFPSWKLAQPFRMIAHNGEINTIRGNRLWLHARESIMQSEFFEIDLQKLFPIIQPNMSDSGSLDNALEFFHLTGRSLPRSLAMLIPEPWNEKNPIPNSLKSFYEYYSTMMEPWDGPASVIFTDGRFIGGTLDRNGLRPSRYIITKNDLLIMGSEVGVQSFEPKDIKRKGLLESGKILLVDTKFKIIIPDSEIKTQLSQQNPYKNWLEHNRIILKNVQVKNFAHPSLGDKYDEYVRIFDYTKEYIEKILQPMVMYAKEPIASMGNDTPLAILSKKPQRFFNYFRQRFAQVTNPPIDPLREDLVMSLTYYMGSTSKNILEDSSDHCKMIKLSSPILTNTDLEKIKYQLPENFSHLIIDIVFPVKKGEEGMLQALDNVLQEAEEAVNDGKSYVILSDRNVSKIMAPIPVLLAVSAVNHHLIQQKKRMQIGIIVESGDVREVSHFAQVLAFGASCINPYTAFGIISRFIEHNVIQMNYQKAEENYIQAINNGLLKIMSKLGISKLNSYIGSQNFEAIGINESVTKKYFKELTSPIGGLGLIEIAREVLENHNNAFTIYDFNKDIQSNGTYNFRKYGEKHSWNPLAISLLQWACSTNNYNKYKEFAQTVNENTKTPHFLRGMFNYTKNPIPIDEVEPSTEIVKRFITGAMSYGSISKEAHETLAIAMNTLEGRSNTGEGGENPERYSTNKRSAIKQVASGRFGVTTSYLINADELQIKIAQGAKPGEGGQLPGFKVNKIIAKLRNSTPGISLISPPPHHDIYSIEDLAQLIYDLKAVNPQATISVKLVSGDGVGTIAAGVAKANADIIVISGAEGGTGASPQSSIHHAGTAWELGLAETQQTLVMNNLRGRIKLQTDGQIKTGLDVVYAAMLGADEFGISTAALIVLGCVMVRKCHMNTCPTGIATQNKLLRKRFKGRAEWLINYFRFVAEEVREIMAVMGFKRMNDLIGKSYLLEQRTDFNHWKINTIDLSKLTFSPENVKKNPTHYVNKSINEEKQTLDYELIKLSKNSLDKRQKVWIYKRISNTNRSVGAMLSGEVAKRYGNLGLSKNTINCKFVGSAGQSFASFLVQGINFRLEGEANDYLGKGLSGGKLVVVPPFESAFNPEDNIIAGNTCLYGATAGFVYIRGIAGQRFCVRNSGANVVVEGLGDHGCEYMTGGRVVVLGKTGRNFAAGMSGGIAYVLDMDGNFKYYCNTKMVSLEKLDYSGDINELQFLINKHLLHTNSNVASRVLTNWEKYHPKFIKVIPLEYKKVLEEEKLKQLKQQLKLTEEHTYYH